MSLKFSSFLLLILAIGMACEDSEPEIDNIDPFMRVVFINQDSLEKLNTLIDGINIQVEDIDSMIGVLDTLDNGIDHTETIDSLSSERSQLNAQGTEFSSTVTDIENGRVSIASITSPEGVTPLLPSLDTAEVFRIPLNPASDMSDYEISLAGRNYSLEVLYERNTVVAERTVIVEAFLTGVSSDDFLNVTYNCQDTTITSCTSNATIVTAYF